MGCRPQYAISEAGTAWSAEGWRCAAREADLFEIATTPTSAIADGLPHQKLGQRFSIQNRVQFLNCGRVAKPVIALI